MRIFQQKSRDFFPKDFIKFSRIYIFVSGCPFLYSLNNFNSRSCSHIRCDEDFLQIIQNLIIHLGFSYDSFGNFIKKTLSGLFQTFVQRFFFFFLKNIFKPTHLLFFKFKIISPNVSIFRFNKNKNYPENFG